MSTRVAQGRGLMSLQRSLPDLTEDQEIKRPKGVVTQKPSDLQQDAEKRILNYLPCAIFHLPFAMCSHLPCAIWHVPAFFSGLRTRGASAPP